MASVKENNGERSLRKAKRKLAAGSEESRHHSIEEVQDLEPGENEKHDNHNRHEGNRYDHKLSSKKKKKKMQKTKEQEWDFESSFIPLDNDDEKPAKVPSIDKNDQNKKKTKKKRDRWGRVLEDTSNLQDENINAGEAYDHGNDTPHSHTQCDSYEGEYDDKTVCVGGMPYETTEEEIKEFFAECGTISRVLCIKFADTQRFKGIAFITFETESAASKAFTLDGANMGGRLIKVDKFKTSGKALRPAPKREAGSLSVYIGNLDWGVQKIDIKRFFKGCDIDEVRLAFDHSTGEFRGYGHVDFSDEQSLEKAIKLDQKHLHGRPARISYALRKGSKGQSG